MPAALTHLVSTRRHRLSPALPATAALVGATRQRLAPALAATTSLAGATRQRLAPVLAVGAGQTWAARRRLPALLVGAACLAWAALFSWLAVARHLAGGSHAEDLGFTDQVIGNFLRGQWFRMSIYQGATWNTELDVTRLARPDSLLAFHVEPMLLLFVPVYALGGSVTLLLVLQAAAVAFGAVPAYRLAKKTTDSATCGLAVAASYLLSPLGQWAVLADFHTSTLAAPLLLLAVERLVVGRSPVQSVGAACLALSAREDVGPCVALLGVIVILRTEEWRRTGAVLVALGLVWTVVCLFVLRAYAGSDLAFSGRYADSLGDGVMSVTQALSRPGTLGYALLLALSGGWLGLAAPLSLLPTLPSLAINSLSSSPWMASGQAHYSGLALPIITTAAADGLRRLHRRRHVASVVLLVTSVGAYLAMGAGPWAANYAPAAVTDHAARANSMASALRADASVSASTALVPHLSRRARVYVFPAVLDAEYVFLDLHASPAPTSAGDVFLRVDGLLGEGGWRVASAGDGLLLLERDALAPPSSALDLGPALFPVILTDSNGPTHGPLALRSATLIPSPDAALEPDGPRWLLRTTWHVVQPLPPGARLDFYLDLRDGTRRHVWDVAHLWWHPPQSWTRGQTVTIDLRDVPPRTFATWQASLSSAE